MTQLSYEMIHELWDEIDEYSWTSFRQLLNDYYYGQNGSAGLDDQAIDTLIQLIKEFEYSGEPFPKTANELYGLFRRQYRYA